MTYIALWMLGVMAATLFPIRRITSEADFGKVVPRPCFVKAGDFLTHTTYFDAEHPRWGWVIPRIAALGWIGGGTVVLLPVLQSGLDWWLLAKLISFGAGFPVGYLLSYRIYTRSPPPKLSWASLAFLQKTG